MSIALVTGATGYIGSMLTRRLVRQGWEVHVIIRHSSSLVMLASELDKINVHRYDGTSERILEIVQSSKAQFVFHLASLFLPSHEPSDIGALINSNIVFSTQLIDAMVASGAYNLINTGSSWQHFGLQQDKPVNLYAATKSAFEQIIEYYVDAHKLRVSTLLLFDTYGPGDPRSKIISLLWKSAYNRTPLKMSPGEQLMDLVFIDDVVDAYMQVLESMEACVDYGHQRYGVSSKSAVSLKELVSIFEHATGLRIPVAWGERPYRVREVMEPWLDFNSVPGWRAKVPLSVGLPVSQPTHSLDY